MRKILVFGFGIFITASAWAVPYLSGYVTNITILTRGEDTNHFIVVGAGSTFVNGTNYLLKSSVGGVTVWTNKTGSAGVINEPGGEFSSDWAITNGSGTELYYANDPPTQWFRTGGVNPAPTGGLTTYGFSTNDFTNFVCLPFPTPLPIIQSNILYVSTNGNDYSAVKGRLDLPWRTVYRAVTNAVAGDVVKVGPGYYEESGLTFDYNIPAGVCVRGEGEDITFLHGKDSSPSSVSKFYLGTSNVFSDFTATNIFFYGGLIVKSTNSCLYRVRATALGDVVVATFATYGMLIEDCDFGGNSDKIADLSVANTDQTNYFIVVKNTRVSGGNGQDGDGLNILGGSLRKLLFNVYSDVANGVKTINSTTNFGTTLPGWTKRPATIRTNFIDGQLYTNVYSVDIDVSCTISNVVSGTAGGTRHALWIYPQTGSGITGCTNYFGDYHQALTATTNLGVLSGSVISGQVYTFTNQTTGANNDSKIVAGSGTLKIP